MHSTRAAAVIVVLVLLGGCSDEVGPDSPAPPVKTAPTSASLAPDDPDEVAFVRTWFSELDAMRHSGRSDRYRDLSKGCLVCESYADTIEDMYRTGGGIRGGRMTGLQVTRLGDTSRGQHAYFVTCTSTPSSIVDSGLGGRGRSSAPRQEAAWHVWLRPTGSSYVMEKYQSLGEPQEWMARAVPDTAPDGETPEEFVKRYYAITGEMLDSGDVKAYREITRGCDTCQQYADRVSGLYRDGGAAQGGSWTVRSTHANRFSEAYLPILDVTVVTRGLRVRESGQGPWKREPTKRQRLEMDLVWTPDGYRVLDRLGT